jgi:hypothetical protein
MWDILKVTALPAVREGANGGAFFTWVPSGLSEIVGSLAGSSSPHLHPFPHPPSEPKVRMRLILKDNNQILPFPKNLLPISSPFFLFFIRADRDVGPYIVNLFYGSSRIFCG